MTAKSPEAMLQELYQAVVGIPNNSDDNGMIGDFKDFKALLIKQNDRIRKNEQRIFKIWGILIGIGALGGAGIGLSY